MVLTLELNTKGNNEMATKNEEIKKALAEEMRAKMEQVDFRTWRKCWDSSNLRQQNLFTKKPYNGINEVMTSLTAAVKGFESPFWGTFSQINAKGGHVLKGEKATRIVFCEMKKYIKQNEDGEEEEHRYFLYKEFKVFNVCQTSLKNNKEFFPEKEYINRNETINEAELIIKNSEAPVNFRDSDRAFYSPNLDLIVVPLKEQFTSTHAMYSTVMHEIAHSTGHASRLNRFKNNKYKFGSRGYAFEELIAEYAAFLTCRELKIQNDEQTEENAKYLKSWLTKLDDDYNYFFDAVSLATDASEYMLSYANTKMVSEAA